MQNASGTFRVENEKDLIDSHVSHMGIPSAVVWLSAHGMLLSGRKPPQIGECQSITIII